MIKRFHKFLLATAIVISTIGSAYADEIPIVQGKMILVTACNQNTINLIKTGLMETTVISSNRTSAFEAHEMGIFVSPSINDHIVMDTTFTVGQGDIPIHLDYCVVVDGNSLK